MTKQKEDTAIGDDAAQIIKQLRAELAANNSSSNRGPRSKSIRSGARKQRGKSPISRSGW